MSNPSSFTPDDDFEFAPSFSNSHIDRYQADDAERRMAEQEVLIRSADELPFVRPSLRHEFLAEVATIERRREARRRVLLTAIAVFSVVPLWWLSQAWPERAVAQHVPIEARAQSMLPKDSEKSLEDLPAEIVGAIRNPDAFKLVDAFTELRHQHSASFSQPVTSDGQR